MCQGERRRKQLEMFTHERRFVVFVVVTVNRMTFCSRLEAVNFVSFSQPDSASSHFAYIVNFFSHDISVLFLSSVFEEKKSFGKIEMR